MHPRRALLLVRGQVAQGGRGRRRGEVLRRPGRARGGRRGQGLGLRLHIAGETHIFISPSLGQWRATWVILLCWFCLVWQHSQF